MKKIVWITADYFIDVDKDIVPYIQSNSEYDIRWYVIRGIDKSIQIPENKNYTGVYSLRYRGSDPRVIIDYIRIFKSINLKNADIIYSDYVGVPYYFFIIKKMAKGIPIIHAAHNVIPYPVWPISLKLYIIYIFKVNKFFHLFSEFTSTYFSKTYPDKCTFYAPMVVKGFGDVTTDNYNIDPSKINLLFFGNIVLNKRLDLLIDAVKSLPKEFHDKIHLSICGKCNDKDKYEKLIDNFPMISTKFQRIDDCEVAELFTKHDFLVLPYQDVAQSGPHMIAYYYNLPVIASDIEGFKERVINNTNGYLFKVNNKQSLIDTIIKAAKQTPEEYAQMKVSLKKFSTEQYSVKTIAKKYIDFFDTNLKH